jgi:hypothetical protein
MAIDPSLLSMPTQSQTSLTEQGSSASATNVQQQSQTQSQTQTGGAIVADSVPSKANGDVENDDEKERKEAEGEKKDK